MHMIIIITTILCIIECSVQSDVVFVMDSSISVTPDDFNKSRQFVLNVTNNLENITSRFPQSDFYNRIGVIIYGARANTSLNLTRITEKEKMIIMKLKHLRETTNTADGLCRLMYQPWSNNSAVLRLAIVLSDGMSNENAVDQKCIGKNVKKVADEIHTSYYPDIIVAAIGIGDVNLTELSYIASNKYLIRNLKQYNNLESMPGELRYQICYTRENKLLYAYKHNQFTAMEVQMARLSCWSSFYPYTIPIPINAPIKKK